MEDGATSGIIISVHETKDEYGEYVIESLDVFTVDYGISRWFFTPHKRPLLYNIMFADVEIIGHLANDTCGIVQSLKICDSSEEILRNNNSYQHAELFVHILRNIVFDGVPMSELLTILYQFVRNLKNGLEPSLVLFKALYLTSKVEGYPVDQDWLSSLNFEDQKYVKSLLRTRKNIETRNDIDDIINSLKIWMLSQV